MQKRINRALTRVRERTSVGYAKIATMGGLSDVNLIITKATPHDDFPLPERYVHDLLKIFSISPSSHSAFALAFAGRFRKTKSWRVALKCLLLLHRLLHSSPDNCPLRAELLWARTNGMLSLHPCNFRDRTSAASDDYTAFITAYARLLDETLDYIAIESDEDEIEKEDEDENRETTPIDMGRRIGALPQLQSLIDRAIDCWPIGVASRSFLVQSAMKHVIRDSIRRYGAFRREIEKVLERLIQLPHRSCTAAFGVYRRAAAQAEELTRFHEWCKSMGYCGSYEYPLIDRIPEIQIRALETFLDGMWQLSDRSSDSDVSDEKSPISTSGDGGNEEAEEEPLIKGEEEEESSSGWEDLLEASIDCTTLRNSNGWEMEVYNPPNPFYEIEQPNMMKNYLRSSCPNTPLQHRWIGVYDATCA